MFEKPFLIFYPKINISALILYTLIWMYTNLPYLY